jgi:hypothetical protein
MANPNIPIGSDVNYPQKTPPFSRDIIEWMRDNLVGPAGPKGDKGDTGATGATGAPGADADEVQAEYSADGVVWTPTYNQSTHVYIRFSYDGGSTWGASIYFKGADGAAGTNGNDVLVQYSTNNTDWFSTPQNPTEYIRFSTDGGSTYGTSFECRGTAGTNGTNAYLYIAWADDASGNGFTLTFDPSKDFRAEYQSTTPITPVQSTFNGLWKDISGATGTAGTNAYVYIGYASDSSGSNFSLTPSSTLNYIAVLSTSTYKDPPVQADFTGLWKKYKGDAGTNADYMLLPNAASVTLRCNDPGAEAPDWTFDSGDNMPGNPLSSSAVDLVIQHSKQIPVVDVIVKSRTASKETKLIGSVAYSTFEDDINYNYLAIKSLATIATDIVVYILFES